jgi:hypothetical protein
MEQENQKIETSSDKIINPSDVNMPNPSQDRTINIKNDGIVERQSSNVKTNDGRELLKDNF